MGEYLDYQRDTYIYKMKKEPYERFLEKVIKTGSCWGWTGAHTQAGYAVFSIAGKFIYGHRYSFQLSKGNIPDGLQLDHLCDNKGCVNPEHLEIVTNQENQIRRYQNNPRQYCDKGHLFTKENTMYIKSGTRLCRICAINRTRKWRNAEWVSTLIIKETH